MCCMLMSCVLPYSTGNILEGEAAIVALKESKAISEDIKAKQAVGAQTEKTIDQVCALLKHHGSCKFAPSFMYTMSDPNLPLSTVPILSLTCFLKSTNSHLVFAITLQVRKGYKPVAFRFQLLAAVFLHCGFVQRRARVSVLPGVVY